MRKLLEHPGVHERATEERSGGRILSSSVKDSLRVTEHGHARRGLSNRRLVAPIILRNEPMFPHGTHKTLDRCTSAKGPNKCIVEYPLADVWLDGYEQRPVREPSQKPGNEHDVVGESESESVEEHDRPRLGVFGIPILRDTDHVFHTPMYTELHIPMMFQEFMSENVADGDEGVPKEGAE